jgi:hypothetical protein
VKIASGRITIPPNIFTRDVAKLSVDLDSEPSNQEEPSGAPSNPEAQTEPTPHAEDCGPRRTSSGSVRSQAHRQDGQIVNYN